MAIPLPRGGVSLRWPPPRVYLPLILFVGYLAFLISGFNVSLGSAQPLPIYLFFAFLLLLLQAVHVAQRPMSRLLYLVVTSCYAVIYSAAVVFDDSPRSFTRSPYIYILAHLVLIGVFLYDAVDRRRGVPPDADPDALTTMPTIPMGARTRLSPVTYGAIGTDCAAFAILFYTLWLLMDGLGAQTVAQFFNLPLHRPYVIVDLNAALFLGLNPSISTLAALDLALAFMATAAALLLMGAVGVVSLVSALESGPQPATVRSRSALRNFGDALRTNLLAALNQLLLALRLPMPPVLWLVPGFTLALVARRLTDYFNRAAEIPNTYIPDLFNPLSEASRNGFLGGILNLVLLFVAVNGMTLSVALAEHDSSILKLELAKFYTFGRTITLTAVFFIYSLAALNAVAVLLFALDVLPFQFGAAGLFALALSAFFDRRYRRQKRAPTAARPTRVPLTMRVRRDALRAG